MNKLITYNDGSYMPFWQKDLEFIQEAFKIPFVKLCETLLGKTSGIIAGCKVGSKGSATAITEGLVLMDGEIVYCPPQSVSGVANILKKQDAYDETGDKVFKVNDGAEVRQTYYTPTAVLTNGLSEEIHNPDPNIKTLLLNAEGKKTLLECLFEVFYEKALAMPYTLEGKELSGGGLHMSSDYGISYAKIGKRVHVLMLEWIFGGDMPIQGGGEGGETIRGGEGEGEGESEEEGEGAAPKAITPPTRTIFTFSAGYRPVRDISFVYQDGNGNMNMGKVSAATGEILIANNIYNSITAVAFSYLTA